MKKIYDDRLYLRIDEGIQFLAANRNVVDSQRSGWVDRSNTEYSFIFFK